MIKYRIFGQLGMLLFVALVFSGYEWNFTAPQSQQSNVEDNQAADGPSISEARELSQEEIDDLDIPQTSNLPKIPRLPQLATPQAVKAPVKSRSFNSRIPNVKGTDVSQVKPVSVPDVQKRIQEIIKLNDGAKQRYRSLASELSRIAERAQIHQKILRELQSAKRTRAVSVPQDTRELVRQEKIRLISEETQNNYDFLSNLKTEDTQEA